MKKEVKILGALAILVVVAAFVGANYYRSSIQSERKPAMADSTLVRPDSPTIGAADAPVTIVEFLDPECESCRAFNPTMKKILKEYDGKTRLVVRYLTFHPNSALAATYTEAAGEQGKYWQMQDLLFQRQSEWGERHGQPAAQQQNVPALFEKYAMELGLDVAKVNAAVKENRYAVKFERDKKDGQSLGARQTPTVFVNGRKLARLTEADLKSLINEELKK